MPLGWLQKMDMAKRVNPLEQSITNDYSNKQTFEWRASDGFANTYLLMSALCCAALHGFKMENALEVANRTYIDLGVDINDPKNEAVKNALEQLPDSCMAAALELEKDRAIYKDCGIFTDDIIDYTIRYLKNFNDVELRESLTNSPAKLKKLVQENIDNG